MAPYKMYKGDEHTDIEFEDDEEEIKCECCKKRPALKNGICRECNGEIDNLVYVWKYTSDHVRKYLIDFIDENGID